MGCFALTLKSDSRLPISYKNAIPILKALKGKGIKASDISADWVGGLEFHGVDYWSGPSDVDLHFVNEVNTVSLTCVCRMMLMASA